MKRFEKSSEVRKYLKAKGVDVGLVKVRKSMNPFSGATSFVVEAKAYDGPVVSDGQAFYGRPGSKTVKLLGKLRSVLVGTNALVG